MYYGLPAAGVICLSLLNQSFATRYGEHRKTEVFQNLSVLVAEVEKGALVHSEDSNYALLARATQTVKGLIGRILTGELTKTTSNQSAYEPTEEVSMAFDEDSGAPWANQNLWDFEMDFWLNLAEHPTLAGIDYEL